MGNWWHLSLTPTRTMGIQLLFVGDTTEKQMFLKIVKLDKYNIFEEAQEWPHPEIKAIMNVTDSKIVLQLVEEYTVVHVSKIIPLPTFLVLLFMNKGHPWMAVASFQSSIDDFFQVQAASKQVKRYMKYIFDFLLAATGSKDEDEEKDKSSQLAINMEDIEFNPVMMQ